MCDPLIEHNIAYEFLFSMTNSRSRATTTRLFDGRMLIKNTFNLA